MEFSKFEKLLQDKQISFKKDEELREYTTLYIGGKARILSEPENEREIAYIIHNAKELAIPYLILGNGSNTLISDHGFEGIVIVLTSYFHSIEVHDTKIIAKSGADLKDICKFAYEHSLTGLEFAYGIPGSCGGTTYMNAGAYGGEVGDVIFACKYIDEDGNICVKNHHDLHFSYRHSCFSHRPVCILEVTYQLSYGDMEKIKSQMDENMQKRMDKQPLEYHSAGSTFKRPEGNYASKLINDCGLKGYAHGDAQVSQKHAGFLINTGHASFQDFIGLIQDVKEIVYDKTGYQLECEVKIVE